MISYYDQFVGVDWVRYSTVIGKVTVIACSIFGLMDMLMQSAYLAGLWSLFAGYVVALWEFPFMFLVTPNGKELQIFLMERMLLKYAEARAVLCLLLGLFCYMHFGYGMVAGGALLVSSVLYAFAAINRRADEAAGVRSDATPYEYPSSRGQRSTLLSTASQFGTF